MGDFFEKEEVQMFDPFTSAIATGDVAAGDPFDLTGMKGQRRATAMQQEQNRLEREIRERLRQEARADLREQFPLARQDVMTGAGEAFDVMAGALPAELAALQGGNVAAQQALISGLPQFQSALLTGQVDPSVFTPQSISFDTSFLPASSALFNQAAPPQMAQPVASPQQQAAPVNTTPIEALSGLPQNTGGQNGMTRDQMMSHIDTAMRMGVI